MAGHGVGAHVTVTDNSGDRHDAEVKAIFFENDTRYVILKMAERNLDGDPDELDERINARGKPEKRQKGRERHDSSES